MVDPFLLAAQLRAQGADRSAVLAALRQAGLSDLEAAGVANFAGEQVSRCAEWISREAVAVAARESQDSLGMVLADGFFSPFLEYAFGCVLHGAYYLLMCLLGLLG